MAASPTKSKVRFATMSPERPAATAALAATPAPAAAATVLASKTAPNGRSATKTAPTGRSASTTAPNGLSASTTAPNGLSATKTAAKVAVGGGSATPSAPIPAPWAQAARPRTVAALKTTTATPPEPASTGSKSAAPALTGKDSAPTSGPAAHEPSRAGRATPAAVKASRPGDKPPPVSAKAPTLAESRTEPLAGPPARRERPSSLDDAPQKATSALGALVAARPGTPSTENSNLVATPSKSPKSSAASVRGPVPAPGRSKPSAAGKEPVPVEAASRPASTSPVVVHAVMPEQGLVFVSDRAVSRRIRWRPGPVRGPPLPLDQPDAADDDDDDVDANATLRRLLGRKRIRSGLTVDGGDGVSNEDDDPFEGSLFTRRTRARRGDRADDEDHDPTGNGGGGGGGNDKDNGSLPFMGTMAPMEAHEISFASPASDARPTGDPPTSSSRDPPAIKRPRTTRSGASTTDADGDHEGAVAVEAPRRARPAGVYGRTDDEDGAEDDEDGSEPAGDDEEEDGDDDDDDMSSDGDAAEAYFRRNAKHRPSTGARGRGRGGGRGRGSRGGQRGRGGRGDEGDGGPMEAGADAGGAGRGRRARGGRGAQSHSVRTMAQLPLVTDEELREALASLPDPWKAARATLADLHASQYSQWRFELEQGFSLLFYGYGSKKALLMQFASRALTDSPVMVVNGYFPSFTIRTVLAAISNDVLRDARQTFRSIHEHAAWIARQFHGAEAGSPRRKLYLLVLSIDGPSMRNAKTQAVLSQLAAASGIHVIATVDHLNSPLLWNSALNARFNWIWHDGTTFAPFANETANETSLLGEAGQPTVRSVGQVLRSLTANARSIFAILARHQLEQQEQAEAGMDADDDGANGDGGAGAGSIRGLTFAAYYARCLDAFVVSNDVSLRSQLTEFRDHRIIQTVRAADGTDYLQIPLDHAALSTILEQMA